MIENFSNFLIIGSVWPEPDSSAAGQRMMQLIEAFRAAGWQVTFASAAAKAKHAADLEKRGIETVSIEINNSAFDAFVSALQPSAVMFDRFTTEEQFGWRVAEQCPQALRVLDTEDLHCLRRTRSKALKDGRDFSETDLLTQDDAKREIASICRCDLSLIISEFEMRLLTDFFKIDEALLQYVPFLLSPVDDAAQRIWPSFEKRRHFVTIGNFRHAPNWDAIKYLHEAIWPSIVEQLPETELHIYGAYPTPEARSLHQAENGFFIDGRAESAEEAVGNARVLLAPLRFGAGLKGKLIKAMQCGTPSVTTPVGAEGIAGQMDWSGITAGRPEDLADAAVKLYTNKAEWTKAQKQGIQIINNRFEKNKFESELMGRVQQLRKNLEQHRRQNFIGSMLRHHTTASTKYMAKWIEEKNRS